MVRPRPLTVVIKLGTSSIVDEKTHDPHLIILSQVVEAAVKLIRDGHRVIIISSGAIGVGLNRMDYAQRPADPSISELQALAAIGQCRLMRLWDELFAHFEQPIAQILLTRSDIQDHTRYRNARSTFTALMDMNVIPIVNENDTLSVAEIKFGDNDTLSAITAAMVHADYLFLMTDVDCLYDKNPRTNPDAQAIEVVSDLSQLNADVSSAGSSLGTGGMSTKIVAAKLATSAGVTTVVTKSDQPGNIAQIIKHCQEHQSPAASRPPSIAENESAHEEPMTRSASSLSLTVQPFEKPPLHTRFLASTYPMKDDYFWLLHGLEPHGTIYIDQGAYKALIRKAGLLPRGVVDVEGSFRQFEAVRLAVVERSSTPDTAGRMWEGTPVDIGRCLANYDSTEVARIKGHQSAEIKEILGYADSEHVAARNLIYFLTNTLDSHPATPRASRAPTPTIETNGFLSVKGVNGVHGVHGTNGIRSP